MKSGFAIQERILIMKESGNIAVLFPGIGYTCDKPLLYYSEKLVRELVNGLEGEGA